MALRELDIAMIIVVLGAFLWAGVSAQSGCTSAIVSLSPCLSYIMGSTSTPSSPCCTQFASVVSNQGQCLCAVLNGGASNFGLNRTQALALPAACNVQTPPVSQCNAVSPAASPTGTPASPTASTPSVPSETTPTPAKTKPSSTSAIPTGIGSRTVPSTNGAPSTVIMPLPLLLSLFFIATYASSLTVF